MPTSHRKVLTGILALLPACVTLNHDNYSDSAPTLTTGGAKVLVMLDDDVETCTPAGSFLTRTVSASLTDSVNAGIATARNITAEHYANAAAFTRIRAKKYRGEFFVEMNFERYRCTPSDLDAKITASTPVPSGGGARSETRGASVPPTTAQAAIQNRASQATLAADAAMRASAAMAAQAAAMAARMAAQSAAALPPPSPI